MTAILIVLRLITLHAIDGRVIEVNPAQITSMLAAKAGKTNQVLHESVYCVVNLTDGRFVSVAETCDEVRQLLEGAK